MAKTNCPVHEPNDKRAAAKAKRGFGRLAMEKAGMTQPEWARKYDPLFQVKGQIRHNRLKGGI